MKNTKHTFLALILLSTCFRTINAQVNTGWKLNGPVNPVVNANPLIPGEGNADPSVRIFNGTAYLYPSHDYSASNNDWLMYDWKTYASTDLLNWTDKGVILSGNNLSWAKYKQYLWAPDCIYSNGNYYFYFPIGVQDEIGVAKSTSPSGPFTDPLGHALVKKGAGFGRAIDPAAFIDDNGKKYLLWGNGACNIAELNDDMISFKSAITKLTLSNAPQYAEGPWLFKRNGTYYLFYSKDGTYDYSSCDYATASNVMGPYKWKGKVVAPTSTIRGTGHGSVFQFNDQWYVAYARLAPTPYYRKSNIDYLFFNDNGDILQAAPTEYGVGRYDGNNKIEAEKYFDKSGNIKYKQCSEGGFYIGTIENGSWVKFPKVDFGAGKAACTVRAASATGGGTIEIRKGSLTGALLGTINVSSTGGDQVWQSTGSSITNTAGVNDIYFVFTGGSGNLFNVNWFVFSASVTPVPPDIPEVTNEITVFPNPAGSVLHIQMAGSAQSDETVELFDAIGKKLMTHNLGSGESLTRFDISGIGAGLYFVKCKGQTRKFLISR